MNTPPVHNSIVQWNKGDTIFFNIFDSPQPGYFDLSSPGKDWELFLHVTYEAYMKDLYRDGVSIYIPTTATTVEEALQLYPELFI